MNASATAPANANLWARMALRLTRDKADTLLLLAAALLVIAPHFDHLPLWISGAACLTLAWRAAITWRGKRMPPLWLLLPISVLAMAGVWYSHRTLLGRDPGVAMLTLLLAFKLLEMHARRDLYVVTFLSFFLLLTNFFYSQSIATALSMVVTIIVLLTAQITFQYTGMVPPLMQRLRTATKMFLLAAPLGLLLFVGFPRIQGPLWGMPSGNSGRTGISDTMAPGSMSNLALSEDVAFRVKFNHEVPTKDQLYWRGVVLSEYDGLTWRRIGKPIPALQTFTKAQLSLGGTAYPYEITQEVSGRRFLFPLEFSYPRFELGEGFAGLTTELESMAPAPFSQRARYSTVGYVKNSVQPDLQPAELLRWLQLPVGFNERTLALGRSLRTSEGDDDAIIAAMLRHFNKQPFEYTLEPPLLGRDAVDEFLFTTRQGFCEHYAGAFTVVMRAAGIPARVVTGYQGGELNPVDGYHTIRQSDAHAWAEVWLAGRGWVRIDPTGQVAPERIQLSLSRALPSDPPFGLAGLVALQNDSSSWLSKMRFSVSAMNNAWNQWVLDYNPERQQNFLRELGDQFGNLHTVLMLLPIAALLLLVRKLRARRRRDPLEAAYDAFCRLLARHGLSRAPHEGPHTLAARVARLELNAQKKTAMTDFLALYGALKYGAPQSDQPIQSVKRLNYLLKQSR